ncbi:MAG: FAD-dependent oxidoreductase, partial [Candidatus Omnitrophica bacterium]|nr:FAD-dependent oxidoreductase [Candidatus Omnitrophota bacterium]
MDSEVVIIGAGVIGLAVANKIAKMRHSVILLEKEPRYGCGASSRNTEVIHAGIYYQTPLKAKLCVEGKELLYRHCERYGIRHMRIGKIILAVSKEEVPKLDLMKKQALNNGVRDLVELEKNDIKKMEPEIKGLAALYSPSSGIFDSHGFMESLFRQVKASGVIFAALSPFIGAEAVKGGWRVEVGGRDTTTIVCKMVINAAGLYSLELAGRVFPGR